MKPQVTCDCRLCVRDRKFKESIATIENEEARIFFKTMYNELGDVEEELEFTNCYQRNLRDTYPVIYREMRTIAPIAPGTEKFPEINI